MDVAIAVSNLSVSFAEHHILQKITLNFAANQVTTLIGPSGSGKTTLLRSFNRLNEEYADCNTQGAVKINLGQGLVDIYASSNELQLPLLRQKVGMLFQTPQVLPVSIYQNIAMPLTLVAGFTKNEAKSRVEEVLLQVGLWPEVHNRLDIPAYKLSGGQQQRLCLARMLALQPSVLLLDEPTGSLDVHSTQMIENLLDSLRESYTIIMVSHSIDQASRLADQLVVMQEGQVKTTLAQPINPAELTELIKNSL